MGTTFQTASQLDAAELRQRGLPPPRALAIKRAVAEALRDHTPAQAWDQLSRHVLECSDPFAVHRAVFEGVYHNWDHAQGPPALWLPDAQTVAHANITALAQQLRCADYRALHAFSVTQREAFWLAVIERLGIRFANPAPLPRASGRPWPARDSIPPSLTQATLDITQTCFCAPVDATAIVYSDEGRLGRLSYGELHEQVECLATGLYAHGLAPGRPIAIIMPMTTRAVVAYLAIIRAGGIVVSIADSFAATEIATRLRISGCDVVVTQDVVTRAGKTLALYDKIVAAGAASALVIAESGATPAIRLREPDLLLAELLAAPAPAPPAVLAPLGRHTNILFSSGTTGVPKAIPWTQGTPIKAAADAHLHLDVHPGDVLAWPTSLGWMMGPWLIYAALINRATIALYNDAPGTRSFGDFVERAGVTMLGVVPSLVASWRASRCMESDGAERRAVDWRAIRAFSSTGETSNAEDMHYLSALADYRPIIEYCGGTEIGGAYITGTLVQPCAAGTFSTPALGLDVHLVDEQGAPATVGEALLVPPSLGLSTELLNADHETVYFAGVPSGPSGETLRRHGDQLEALGADYYRSLGRADDAMNLGGIKISAVEIEQTVNILDGIAEVAAIAVPPPGGGPSRLMLYCVPTGGAAPDRDALLSVAQRCLREHINPLFKLHDLVLTDALPRTTSNKLMRRMLRDRYTRSSDAS